MLEHSRVPGYATYEIADRLLPNDNDRAAIASNEEGAKLYYKTLRESRERDSGDVAGDVIKQLQSHRRGHTISEIVAHGITHSGLRDRVSDVDGRTLLAAALQSDIELLEARGGRLPQHGDIFPRPRLSPRVQLNIRKELLADLTQLQTVKTVPQAAPA